MGIILPQFIDTIINNPNAQTSTDGVAAPRTVQTAASAAADNRSSYSQPQTRSAIVLPPSGVLDVITPGSQALGIPSNYQPAVRSAVSNTIATVLATSQSQSGSTDVDSGAYRGNVATRLFSNIRGVVSSTAPTFGVTAGSGPIANGLAVLANSAVDIGKNQVIQKYGTTLLNAQQYAVFGTAVINGFQGLFDKQPDVKQTNTINSVGQGNLPIQLPRPPGGLSLPASDSVLQNAQNLQNGVRGSFVTSSNDVQTEAAQEARGTPELHTYKVYLVSSLKTKDMFVFKSQPVIQVTETAQYSEFSPLHAPGHILSYKNSPSRSFSVSDVKLISRTAYEAQENLLLLQRLRAWVKPYFGRAQIVGTDGFKSSDVETATAEVNPGFGSVRYQTTSAVNVARTASDALRGGPGATLTKSDIAKLPPAQKANSI